VLRLFHGGKVHDLVGPLAVDDLAVRRFDEAVLIDPAEAGERVDEADILVSLAAPDFRTCEVRCDKAQPCPDGLTCATIADDPGAV
jgi:hypothetical protein